MMIVLVLDENFSTLIQIIFKNVYALKVPVDYYGDGKSIDLDLDPNLKQFMHENKLL